MMQYIKNLFPSSVSLKATADGQTYNLNVPALKLELYDGLGLAPTQRLSQRAPGQTGDTDLGGLTGPRFVDMAWSINGRDLDHYRELKETIMIVSRNRETAVPFVFDFGNGRIRAVDLHLDGVLNFSDRRFTRELVSGVFKASDPRLYHPTLRTADYNLLPDTGGLPIPFTVPIPIGASTLNSTQTITYAEASRLAAKEYPVIIVHGPITSPTIKQLTTDEQIALTANGGLALANGQFITIDLSGFPRRDNKTIRDQDGNSVSQYLSTSSDLATWHLAHAGELLADGTYADGTNEIQVIGESVTTNTRIELRYYDRYEGV